METEVIQSDKKLLKIAVSGKLDANEVGNHAWQLYGLLNNCKTPVILNLSGVSFLSSLGIRMLITAAKDIQRNGHSLKVENPSPEAEKVIRLAGLDELIAPLG